MFEFSQEEKNLFEETKEILGNNRNFITDFVNEENRWLAITSTAYFLIGIALMFIGPMIYKTFGIFFFLPVGATFLLPGIIARLMFGNTKQARKMQLDKIFKRGLDDKALCYYRLKLFATSYSIRKGSSFFIEIFLVLAFGQAMTLIANKHFGHETGVIFWSMIAALYLYLTAEIFTVLQLNEKTKLILSMKEIRNRSFQVKLLSYFKKAK
jgi:hypothetical protein